MIAQPLVSDTKLDRTLAKRRRIKAAALCISIFALLLVAQNFVALSG